MKLKIRTVIAFLISLIVLQFSGIVAYAVESEQIQEIPEGQTQQTAPNSYKVNEPLDNAVPLIYKYEIYNEDELTGYIVPGEEFILKFTVYNPAVVTKLGNIRIVIGQNEGLVYPTYGNTNSVFIGYLEPLSYAEGSIRLTAAKTVRYEQVGLALQMSYSDNYSTMRNEQFTAVLPVSTNGNLAVENVNIPSKLSVGENNRFAVNLQNHGLSSVDDIVLYVRGDQIEEQEFSLGSLGGGSSKSSDVYLNLSSTGPQNISIYLTYADNDGVVHETPSREYSISVTNADLELNQDVSAETDRLRSINGYLTIGVVVVSAVMVMAFVIKELYKKKQDKALVKGKKS